MHAACPSCRGMGPCFMRGLFAALAEVMGADRHHHGVPGDSPACRLCFWPWQHRGALPTEMQARGKWEGRAATPALRPTSLPAKSLSGSHFSLRFFPCRPALASVSARGHGSMPGTRAGPVPTLIIPGSWETQRRCCTAGSWGGGRRGSRAEPALLPLPHFFLTEDDLRFSPC